MLDGWQFETPNAPPEPRHKQIWTQAEITGCMN